VKRHYCPTYSQRDVLRRYEDGDHDFMDRHGASCPVCRDILHSIRVVEEMAGEAASPAISTLLFRRLGRLLQLDDLKIPWTVTPLPSSPCRDEDSPASTAGYRLSKPGSQIVITGCKGAWEMHIMTTERKKVTITVDQVLYYDAYSKNHHIDLPLARDYSILIDEETVCLSSVSEL
jgi:hypothetical protein